MLSRAVLTQAMHESGSFNAQELSIIFWSLTKLRHTPPARWVAALLREGLEVPGGLQAQSLVLLLGSLTRWELPQMQTAGHYRSAALPADTPAVLAGLAAAIKPAVQCLTRACL